MRQGGSEPGRGGRAAGDRGSAGQAPGADMAAGRRCGRPSNNRLPEECRARIAALLAGKYEGFGPTLAAEKLAAIEGIAVS